MPVPATWSTPWVPSLGIDLAWRLDGLALLMLLLVGGVGIAVFVYAAGYLKGHPHQGRLFVLLSLFLLAMVGSVLADDLFVLFVCWELTSILSFLLVGFDHANAESRKAALIALIVTGAGGILLLAGCIILAQAAGTSRISDIIALGPALDRSPFLTTGVALIALGCFTKSAQFPFHFWLPAAMAAPAPVSAYLHSATMVKLGVYLLARLDPAFSEWYLWQVVLTSVGSLTAAWAMVLALKERDLKRILAWSTVSALGTMVMLVGAPGADAPLGLAAFMLAHALYKAPLFFVVGNVEKATGRRNVDELAGLRSGMPLTAVAALLAGVGMAGLPLSLGYVAKAVIKEVRFDFALLELMQKGSLFVSAVTVALAGVACIRIFWRRAPGAPGPYREGGLALTGPPLAIAVVGIVLGTAPVLVTGLLTSAARAMLPPGGAVSPGLDITATGGTVSGTLLLGLILYLYWDRIRRAFSALDERLRPFGVGHAAERAAAASLRFAEWFTSQLQGGRMSRYTALLLAALTAGLWYLVLAGGATISLRDSAPLGLAVGGALALIVVGAIVTVAIRQRALQLVAAGIVTWATAVLLLFLGAPDLALTQFAVETIFVIVVATLLLRAWRDGRIGGHPEPRFRPGAALIAVGFGAAVAAILLIVTGEPFNPTLSDFYGERSVPDGYGRNVVNVILVDFRALDTLGEAAVVAFALVATLPLLRALRAARSGEGDA